MPAPTDHPVGLLLGAEEDWPTAFEALAGRLGVLRAPDGTEHTVTTERMTIEPFNLRDKARQELVIDRLAHWYYHPREWLKKVGPRLRWPPSDWPACSASPPDGDAGAESADPSRQRSVRPVDSLPGADRSVQGDSIGSVPSSQTNLQSTSPASMSLIVRAKP